MCTRDARLNAAAQSRSAPHSRALPRTDAAPVWVATQEGLTTLLFSTENHNFPKSAAPTGPRIITELQFPRWKTQVFVHQSFRPPSS